MTLCCSLVKVKHGINVVQSKLQGRHNITAQQLLSFFRVLLYYKKLLINIDSCQKVCAICICYITITKNLLLSNIQLSFIILLLRAKLSITVASKHATVATNVTTITSCLKTNENRYHS